MEDNNDIDDLSRSSLENYRMNPPPQEWDALDADLSAKQSMIQGRKAKRFKQLSVGLILLLISFISFYYLFPSINSNLAVKDNNKIQAGNKKPSVVNQKPVKANTQSLSVTSGEVKKPSGTGQMKINPVYADVKKAKTKALTVDNSSSKKSENELAIYGDKINLDIGSKELNTENIKTGTVDKNNTGDNTVSTTDTLPVNTFANESQTSAILPEKELIPPAASGNPEINTPTEEAVKTAIAENNTKEKSMKDTLTGNNKSRWSIAGYYSADHSKNYLKSNTYSYKDVTKFYENEKPGYSFTTGFSLRYELTKRWSISAGAAYSTIAYSITRPEIYAGYNSNNELQYQYYTSCGIIQMPASEYPAWNLHDSLALNSACAQTVRFIKIPFTGRFTVTKKKLSFYADLGFSANFTLQERAKMKIQNSEITIINNIDGLKKMNYDFLIGMGVQYNFLNGAGIFIQPSFRSAITSLTHNTFVNCYPYSFGLAAGIAYHF